jgi:FkbM family methyltransferase
MLMLLNELIGSTKQHLARLHAALKRVLRKTAEIESGPGKGLRFDVGPDAPGFVSGEYERPVQEAIAGVVHAGDVCYDIGANVGFFSVLLGRLAGPTGSIYAFEPVPKNALTIERNARLNRLDNIKVLQVACSNESGMSELLLAHHIGGAVLKNVGVPPDLAGSLIVETVSIDTLVEDRQIKPPRFIKIDVEGAEMEVLQGMQRVLNAWGPTVILELDDESADACEEKVRVCQRFLQDLDYRMEFLPASYPDSKWFVRHFVARCGR